MKFINSQFEKVLKISLESKAIIFTFSSFIGITNAVYNFDIYGGLFLPTIFFGIGSFIFTFKLTIISNFVDKIQKTPDNRLNIINFNNNINYFIKHTFVFGFISILLMPFIKINFDSQICSLIVRHQYIVSPILIVLKLTSNSIITFLFINLFSNFIFITNSTNNLTNSVIKQIFAAANKTTI